MEQLFVIGEDVLCCALGERLACDVLGWPLAQPAVNKKGVTHLIKDLPRHLGLAHVYPVLCIADADRKCVKELRAQWLPAQYPERFILRLAVPMIESWLLADREALADFLGVAEKHIPRAPDEELDAKRSMLNLARRSRHRNLRDEIVSRLDTSKPGPGYNMHLNAFVAEHWRVREAIQHSPSLARAAHRLEALKGVVQ